MRRWPKSNAGAATTPGVCFRVSSNPGRRTCSVVWRLLSRPHWKDIRIGPLRLQPEYAALAPLSFCWFDLYLKFDLLTIWHTGIFVKFDRAAPEHLNVQGSKRICMHARGTAGKQTALHVCTERLHRCKRDC